jgi:hypothetical protein
MPTQTASAGMPAFLPYPLSPNYQCGDFRGWSLKHKSARTRELGYFTGWDDEPPGHYLENQGNIWMSTSRLERESHAYHLQSARGTVVVCGIGMGMYLFNIAARADVECIIAVDRDAAVIDLLERGAELESWKGREKIRFVHKDALRLNRDDLGPAQVDFLYVDIWPELGDADAVSDTQTIQKAVRAKKVGWWGQELDFVEWGFQRGRSHDVLNTRDLQEFVEMSGMPTSDASTSYVDSCRQAADVYCEYGDLPFAAARRTLVKTRSAHAMGRQQAERASIKKGVCTENVRATGRAEVYNLSMPDPSDTQLLAKARKSLAQPLSFPDFLAKLSARDRANAQRRVTVLDAQPSRVQADVWQRLACSLMTLAPVAKVVGRQAIEYYVPDGRYRMQVFALEDMQDGHVTVYCPDVLKQATDSGLLAQTERPEPGGFALATTGEPLQIEALNGSALTPDAHFKNLTNWNRRALRITLPPAPSAAQVEAVELLCGLAATQFIPVAPADGAAAAAAPTAPM